VGLWRILAQRPGFGPGTQLCAVAAGARSK
jgi:hypothetical protein